MIFEDNTGILDKIIRVFSIGEYTNQFNVNLVHKIFEFTTKYNLKKTQNSIIQNLNPFCD